MPITAFPITDLTKNYEGYQPLTDQVQAQNAMRQSNLQTQDMQDEHDSAALIEKAVRQNTHVDVNTGKPVIDRPKALAQVYAEDADAGQQLEAHFRAADTGDAALAKETAQTGAIVAKAARDKSDHVQTQLTSAIAAVDPTKPDYQTQLKFQIARLRAQGIDVPPEYENMTPEQVQMLKREAIGPDKVMVDERERLRLEQGQWKAVPLSWTIRDANGNSKTVHGAGLLNSTTGEVRMPDGSAAPQGATADTSGGSSVTSSYGTPDANPPSGKHVALDRNNPGGIEDGNFAKSQPGYVPGDGSRYAAFTTIADGIAAQRALLGSYISRGMDTPAKIANRWAPAPENNPATYAKFIASRMGIGVNDTITPDKIPALQEAQALRENSKYSTRFVKGRDPATSAPMGGGGGLMPNAPPMPNAIPIKRGAAAGSGKDSGELTKDDEFLATEMALGEKPPTLGQGQGEYRKALQRRAAAIQSSWGMTPGDAVMIKASNEGLKKALNKVMVIGGQIDQFERTAMLNADQVTQLSRLGAAKSGVPLINKWIQAGRRDIAGNPDVSRFNVAIDTFAEEYAKVMSGAGGNVAATDSARARAHSMINNAMTPQQLDGVITQLKTEMGNRTKGIHGAVQDTLQKLRTGNGAHINPNALESTVDGGAAAPSAPGKILYSPSQKRYYQRSANGNLVPIG